MFPGLDSCTSAIAIWANYPSGNTCPRPFVYTHRQTARGVMLVISSEGKTAASPACLLACHSEQAGFIVRLLLLHLQGERGRMEILQVVGAACPLSCTVLNFFYWSCEFCVSKLEQEKATLAQSTHEYQPNLQAAPPSLVVCVCGSKRSRECFS